MSLNGENKYNIKYNYFIYIIQLILIFIQIPPCYFQSCNKYNNILENSQCFNNIIIIDSSFYRAGHFAKNKNGDIVAEYSIDKDGLAHQRLFYCINKSGKYFYKEKILFLLIIMATHMKEDMNQQIYLLQYILMLIKQKNI